MRHADVDTASPRRRHGAEADGGGARGLARMRGEAPTNDHDEGNTKGAAPLRFGSRSFAGVHVLRRRTVRRVARKR